MRSPSLFEDVIKTVTSCNVTWPSTVIMNRRLCEVVGRAGAFPTARRLARARAGTLRGRCRVGYRDQRIIELSRMFASGALDPEWFEDPATPDDAVWDRLTDLPGIGPYAAANIMQLLGRYSRLPVDTETIRHAKLLLGYRGPVRKIMKSVHRHYAPFGAHAFRSYWFELWAFYEQRRGPAWTWERDTTGSTFTASQF
jgi:3-methyladenine DNA glycosylase/8-oxoguanine DNA glycosylase